MGRSPFEPIFGVPPRLNLPGANPLLEVIGNTAQLVRLEDMKRVLEGKREEGARNDLRLEEGGGAV